MGPTPGSLSRAALLPLHPGVRSSVNRAETLLLAQLCPAGQPGTPVGAQRRNKCLGSPQSESFLPPSHLQPKISSGSRMAWT